MEFEFERLDLALPDDVIVLIRKSYDELARKEFFAFDPDSDGPGLLKLKGYLYEARVKGDGTLAAVIYLAFPHPDNPAAKDLHVPESELGQLKIAVTRKDYRGNGLMGRLAAMAMADARKEGIKYLYATVHPENRASRNNLERAGFSPALQKEMYNGLSRYIMFIEL